MSLFINEEAVSMVNDLAHRIPDSVEKLSKANQDVLKCYDEVKETVGPHTQEIEEIVHELNRLLQQSSDSINEVSENLEKLAARMQKIIDNAPKKSFH